MIFENYYINFLSTIYYFKQHNKKNDRWLESLWTTYFLTIRLLSCRIKSEEISLYFWFSLIFMKYLEHWKLSIQKLAFTPISVMFFLLTIPLLGSHNIPSHHKLFGHYICLYIHSSKKGAAWRISLGET